MTNARTTLDSLRLNRTEKIDNFLSEHDAASGRPQKVVSALRRTMKAQEEIKDKAVDMLIMVKKLYEQARARVVDLRAAEVSDLGGKIDTLTYKWEAKKLKLHTISGLSEEISKLRHEAAKHWEAVAEDKASVAVMSSLRKAVSAVGEAVPDLLPAVEKSVSLQADAEKNAHST